MQIRRFDILTEYVAPDASIETSVQIPWLNARTFQIEAVGIEDAFEFTRIELVSAPWDTFNLQVDATRTPSQITNNIRLAAVISCETDETEPQEPIDFVASWPSLIDE